MDWLPEELNWSRFRDVSTGLSEVHRDSFSHPSRSLRCLQIVDDRRWLTERGYDGRVVNREPTRRGGKAKAFLCIRTIRRGEIIPP
jgi:hypothetical protein